MTKKLLLTFLAALLLMLACSKNQEQSKPVEGKIAFIQGKVEKSTDGKNWVAASLNQSVAANDWIKTAAKSTTKVTMWQSSDFIIRPNSVIQIKELASGQIFTAEVKTGGLSCNVEKLTQNGAHYKVTGLALAAGVRGTKFEVYTDGKKESLKVTEGSVAVKRNIEGAKEQLVTAGKAMSVNVQENEALKKKIQGKTKEEAEKLLEFPIKDEKELEKEFPAETREAMNEMQKFSDTQSKEVEKFSETKGKEIEKMEKKTSKAIDETVTKKGQDIDKMSEGQDISDQTGDDMLKAARKKRAQQK